MSFGNNTCFIYSLHQILIVKGNYKKYTVCKGYDPIFLFSTSQQSKFNIQMIIFKTTNEIFLHSNMLKVVMYGPIGAKDEPSSSGLKMAAGPRRSNRMRKLSRKAREMQDTLAYKDKNN